MEAVAVSVCASFNGKVLVGLTRNPACGVYVEPPPLQPAAHSVVKGCGAEKPAGMHPGAVWENHSATNDRHQQAWNYRATPLSTVYVEEE